MFELNKLNKTQFVLFLCGQDSLIYNRSIHATFKYIPKIISTIIISILITMFFFESAKTNYIRFLGYSVSVPNLIALIESIIKQNVFKQIFNSIYDAFDYLQHKMKINLQWNKFIIESNRKLNSCFIFTALILFVSVFLPSNHFHMPDKIIIAISQIYRFSMIANVVFYVDIIIFISTSILQKLNSNAGINICIILSKSINESLTKLRQTKVAYYKLWNISRKVNEFFQWFLIVVLLELIFTLFHASMGIIIYLNSKPDNWQGSILRKYIN